MNVLMTGAGGFIGRHLCNALQHRGDRVIGVGRTLSAGPWDEFHQLDIANGFPESILNGVEAVAHLAGKAHALSEVAQDEDEYVRVNTTGTQHVLQAAQTTGVRRFVLFSTIKAMGEGNAAGVPLRPIDEADECLPETSYGKSKLAAEKLVLDGGYVTEPVVLRLCMVYGGKEKGNFTRMVTAINRNRFPPIPEFGNRRSLVHVDDVVQAAILGLTHPQAVGRTYLVTDGCGYSTRQMYDAIRTALGKPQCRWNVPAGVLRVCGYAGDLIGKLRRKRFFFDSDALCKLSSNAWYSNERICTELGFSPKKTLDTALPALIAELGLRNTNP